MPGEDWENIVDGFIEASIAITIGYVVYAVAAAAVTGLGFAYNVLVMKIIGVVLLTHLASATALLLLVEPRIKSNWEEKAIGIYALPLSLATLMVSTVILTIKWYVAKKQQKDL